MSEADKLKIIGPGLPKSTHNHDELIESLESALRQVTEQRDQLQAAIDEMHTIIHYGLDQGMSIPELLKGIDISRLSELTKQFATKPEGEW